MACRSFGETSTFNKFPLAPTPLTSGYECENGWWLSCSYPEG